MLRPSGACNGISWGKAIVWSHRRTAARCLPMVVSALDRDSSAFPNLKKKELGRNPKPNNPPSAITCERTSVRPRAHNHKHMHAGMCPACILNGVNSLG